MNYIRQINAFKDYLSMNELPSVAILLWHTLMMINNMSHWKKRFNAPQMLIQQYGGLSKQRLSDARKILMKHGLIHYERGKKGSAPVYEIVVLYEDLPLNEEKNPTSQTETSLQQTDLFPDLSADPFQDQSRTIRKHKQKQKRRRGGERARKFYSENFSSITPAIEDIISDWCDTYTEELVLEAMRTAVMHSGKKLKYIEKILLTWTNAGLKRLEDVREFEGEKTLAQPISFQKRNQLEKQSVFDELREELIG